MTIDNATTLSHGAKVYARKRKQLASQTEEITFNPKARREYLTGFERRNKEKKRLAEEKLKERLRLERIEMRKTTRDARKQLITEKLIASGSTAKLPTSVNDMSDSDKDCSDEHEKTQMPVVDIWAAETSAEASAVYSSTTGQVVARVEVDTGGFGSDEDQDARIRAAPSTGGEGDAAMSGGRNILTKSGKRPKRVVSLAASKAQSVRDKAKTGRDRNRKRGDGSRKGRKDEGASKKNRRG